MSWWEHAACKNRPDLSWFPGARDDPTPPILVCRDCPVRRECLDDADTVEAEHDIHGTIHGIRGGLTARERMGRRHWYRSHRRRGML